VLKLFPVRAMAEILSLIMGGLEGFINILDLEGGFGSLEMQVENI